MLELFNKAAVDFNGWCSERNRFDLPITLETPVAGPGSPLDSMAMVSFIMGVEELFEAKGISVNLSSAEALEHWDTFGTMISYLEDGLHVRV